uniref:Uncharacterized protein n=1 Tax=Arundo donax TaxID=35708 RepID=A0A0A9BCI4_ARUDO
MENRRWQVQSRERISRERFLIQIIFMNVVFLCLMVHQVCFLIV